MNEFDLKVIRLVSSGKTNSEIAEDLGYSEIYIKKTLQKLFKMFQVKNRSGLIYNWLSSKNAKSKN